MSQENCKLQGRRKVFESGPAILSGRGVFQNSLHLVQSGAKKHHLMKFLFNRFEGNNTLKFTNLSKHLLNTYI